MNQDCDHRCTTLAMVFGAALTTAGDVMSELLERMRRNPQADWTISDIETLCKEHDASFSSPKRGSHYKVSHPATKAKLTIPYNRPIKRVYIKLLVAFLVSVRKQNGSL
jgi:hypothetical protein